MMIRATRKFTGDRFQDKTEAEMSGTVATVQAWRHRSKAVFRGKVLKCPTCTEGNEV